MAVIDIMDDISGYQIPLGATAQVAIYTVHWHHVSMIRKILLRLRSWQNSSSSRDIESFDCRFDVPPTLLACADEVLE